MSSFIPDFLTTFIFLLGLFAASLIFGMDLTRFLLQTFYAKWSMGLFRKLKDWSFFRFPLTVLVIVGLLIKGLELNFSHPYSSYFALTPFILRQLLYLLTFFAAPALYARLKSKTAFFASFLTLLVIANLFFVDWGMYLFSPWHSTMFPLLMSTLSMTGILGALMWNRGLKAYKRHEIYEVGRMGIAGVIFSLYLHYAQFLIIWQARIPTEMRWYQERSIGLIGLLLLFLFLAKYLAPLTILFLRERLEKWRPLSLAGALIFCLYPLEILWIYFSL